MEKLLQVLDIVLSALKWVSMNACQFLREILDFRDCALMPQVYMSAWKQEPRLHPGEMTIALQACEAELAAS